MPDILAASTPVGHPFFALAISPKHKKLDCFPNSTTGQSGKRAHAGTEAASTSSGCSTPPIQPSVSHSSEQPEPKLVNFPSSSVKAVTDPNDGLAAEDLGSTVDHDRDSVVEVSGDDADQSGDESDSSSDSQESAADLGPNSATGDCLTSSDTEEAAIITTCKKFQKKVWASCSTTKDCLWSEAQLKQICDSCHAVWGSDYDVIKTEWDLTFKEDCSSFEVNKMMVRTDQLLWVKEATHSKIHPSE